MTVYYNEHDPFAAAWLRNLIKAGLIAPGDVDERSIVDVDALGLAKYVQCHFFAGIGGWSHALRMADWPDNKPVWTGSCPCQPFSLAGAQKGFADDRHLWPVFRSLIAERRPAKVFGEQVASASDWLRLVRGDLEALGYAVGAIPIQAASAGADHLRDRYWFVAHADEPSAREGWQQRSGQFGGTGSDPEARDGNVEYAASFRGRPGLCEGAEISHGDGASGAGDPLEWVIGADGKARRVKPGIRLLAHGIPNRVGVLRGFGNAIDPRCAAAFIKACP